MGWDLSNVPISAPSGTRPIEFAPLQREPRPIAFPHGDEIRARLGHPFASGAVLDPLRCAREHAAAFTVGGRAYFPSLDPPLRVAAHEAAHVLQQQGVTRDMDLGAEGHAAAVADRVIAGKDVRPLLGPYGAAPEPKPHAYTDIETRKQSKGHWHAKKSLRVSDDGYMAIGRIRPGHDLWAAEGLIADSNSVLDKQESAINLKKTGATLAGPAPDASGNRLLYKVRPENKKNQTAGNKMKLWADCQRAAFAVMGVKGGLMGQPPPAIGAVYRPPGTLADKAAETKEKVTSATGPDDMKEEILKRHLGPIRGGAFPAYAAMKPGPRATIDKAAGLNEYAMPGTGEAYTMAADAHSNPKDGNIWRFHWAGVIMASGDDRVTLENFAVASDWSPKMLEQNSKWSFQMYGSEQKPGQTFHEHHLKTDLHGKIPVTMRVRR